MRRDIGRHTNRNTGRSVYQKIRKSCRKYSRFFLGLIKVRFEINRVFIDIGRHFHGNFTQSGLGISHRGSAVSIDRTKVTVTVYQCIAHRPVLSHIYQCTVNRTVSMRMIFTHCITDNTRTFTMRFVRSVVKLYHGIQNSSLYRFQAVSYIRKRTRSNYTHGIIDIEFFHGFLHIHFMDFVENIIFHFFILLLVGMHLQHLRLAVSRKSAIFSMGWHLQCQP